MPLPMRAGWHVYLLRCADGTLYTGIARDLERRLSQHNGLTAGGPKYTRGRRPVELLWSAPAPDRSAALRREAAIKRLSRARKLDLVKLSPRDGPHPFSGAVADRRGTRLPR